MDTRFRDPRTGKAILACCLLIALSHPGISQAKNITLDLSLEVNREGTGWSGHALVKNRGDEAARDLSAALEVLGKETHSSSTKELGVDSTWEVTLPILEGMAPPLLPGTYPATLSVSYHDAAGHPFSALGITFFTFQEDTSSQIIGQVRASQVSEDGTLTLRISNMDQTPLVVSLRWFLPRELVPSTMKEEVRVNARDSVTRQIRVENLSALPGSQYPVFAIMEYDKEGMHFSTKAMAAVMVVEPTTFLSSIRLPLFVLLATLAVVIAFLQFRHWRSAKSI